MIEAKKNDFRLFVLISLNPYKLYIRLVLWHMHIRSTLVIGTVMTILLSTTSFGYYTRNINDPCNIYAQKYTMIGLQNDRMVGINIHIFSVGVKSVRVGFRPTCADETLSFENS